MEIPVLDNQAAADRIQSKENPFFPEYHAFYSSWLGGIILDPKLMSIPMDDHMVHRGDGIFEAMKAEGRAVYLMDEHLKRLFFSAEKIALKPPFSIEQMKEIILATLKASKQTKAVIRLFLSRGPGNFSVNPYDSIQSQLYIVITALTPPSPDKYEKGVRIGKSHLPAKPSWMAQVKSCNYLANALMRKEAVDRGLDFVVGIDDKGHVTECPTENILIVDQQGAIVHPVLDYILKGTTMIRACELASANGFSVLAKPITIDDLCSAKEVLITGTSLNVLPAVKYENQLIGDGKPGPVCKKLNQLMEEDIRSGSKRTPY